MRSIFYTIFLLALTACGSEPTPINPEGPYTPIPAEPPEEAPLEEFVYVELCHVKGKMRTLSVPEAEVAGHLKHGDYLGPCS